MSAKEKKVAESDPFEEELIDELAELNDEDGEEAFMESDFCFIIDSNGMLKDVLMPEMPGNIVPESVLAIFKLYGIRDIDDIPGNATLH